MLIIVLIIFSVVFIVMKENMSRKELLINKEVDFSKYDIKDRYEYTDGKFLKIGKNQKELENDYYDVKINNEKNNLLIYINKLVKNDDFQNFIDSGYLIEINNIIQDITGIDGLYELIYEKFLYLRNNNIDNISEGNIIENISMNGYIINFSTYDNMLVIRINKVSSND